jgi:uncharacterized protein
MSQTLRGVPECLDCGACCHTRNGRLVELLGADAITVPTAYAELEDDGTAHMRMIEDPAHDCLVCLALGSGNACQIYAQRPFLCREFERGSPECLQAIADMSRKRADRIH